MGRFKRSKSKKRKLTRKQYFFYHFPTGKIKDEMHQKIILAEIGQTPLAQIILE